MQEQNKVVAEYALGEKSQPLGVVEYQLVESLPPELQTSLPSIEQIERELAADTPAGTDGAAAGTAGEPEAKLTAKKAARRKTP